MTQRVSALGVCVLVFATFSLGQQTFDVRSQYDKQEVMIPMRDGVRLFTSVYTPKDGSKKYPILLTRTPYSCAPYGAGEFPTSVGTQRARYFRDGYIIVYQDVRGRFMSEGDFEHVRPYKPVKKSKKDIDETTDTYDTVDWLVKNIKNNTGNVGVSGISYPGFYTWMSTIDAHPAIKATSPQAPVSKWMAGDDFYHNGAFLLPHAFNFLGWFGWPRPVPKSAPDVGFDHGTPDEYAFFLRMGPLSNANRLYFHDSVSFWNDLLNNTQWNSYWAERNTLQHLKNLRPATLVVGGWFDTENLYGILHSYAANEKQSPKANNAVVMGPWYHGQWNNENGDSLGAIKWGSSTSVWYTENIEGPFFDYYLKGIGAPPSAEATMFNTGRNEWNKFSSWPPAGTSKTAVSLSAGMRLSFGAPSQGPTSYDEFVSDPNKPVPYTDQITHWYNPAFMLEDQRFASRRPDVLTYVSEPLTEDLTIAGPINVNLTVSTSGTDADWIVKIIDVFPDNYGWNAGAAFSYSADAGVKLGGYEMLIRGDVLRGKFREGLDAPKPFEPGKPTRVSFELNDAFHTFKKGHRMMVHVQGTWFPMVDRNPGVFTDIPNARPEDFQRTTQRVYRSAESPSTITFTTLK